MGISIKNQGQNLTIYQGSTFEKTFTAKDANNSNVVISSGSCASKMKKNYSTQNTSFILDFSTAIVGSNVTISATAEQTSSMKSGLYVYDIEYTQSDGVTKEKIAHGMITLIPEST